MPNSKTILINGAGTGPGESAAIGETGTMFQSIKDEYGLQLDKTTTSHTERFVLQLASRTILLSLWLIQIFNLLYK